MQAAYRQQMRNPVFLIQFADFLRHTSFIAQKHGRKNTSILFSRKKFQAGHRPHTEAQNSIRQHIGYPAQVCPCSPFLHLPHCLARHSSYAARKFGLHLLSIFYLMHRQRKYPPYQLLSAVVSGIVKLSGIGGRLKLCKFAPYPHHITDPVLCPFRVHLQKPELSFFRLHIL